MDYYHVSSMGILNTLINSTVSVLAGLLGFGLLLYGSQQVAYGSNGIGTFVAILGIILLVFASKL